MLSEFLSQLQRNRHRAMVVISGRWPWCLQQYATLAVAPGETYWLGAEAPAEATAITPQQAQQRLGSECRQLVINGFDGIDLNAFGALGGTLTAGGLCILLCPELSQWPTQPDRQSQRFCAYPDEHHSSDNHWLRFFIGVLQQDPYCVHLSQQQGMHIPNLPSSPLSTTTAPHTTYRTEQQQQAVTKIKKVATGHRRRPLVLTADRGRGKSSALGLAAAELLRQGKQHIVISAPKIDSVTAVFARAAEQLTVLQHNPNVLITAEGQLQFVPPDELLRSKIVCDLVMIDEAAAIPAPMLSAILGRYARLVFTSTIHGYEGTGRSFAVRFKAALQQQTPQWQSLHLTQPIRYNTNDPLEQLIYDALMLNAQACEPPAAIDPATAKLTRWQSADLVANPATLNQIMGLLMLAHYKTTPNDLRHLLDGANITLYTLCTDGQIIAAALLASEGGLPDDMAKAIYQGKRRPRGHLLPQTLTYHSGFIEAAAARYARVIRIAVHPQRQSKGLGSALLQQLTTALSAAKFDFLGSCFGATAPLLRFWQHNGCQAVRLGHTVEASSNEYSAVVLKPLNDQAEKTITQMRQCFAEEFPHSFAELHPLLATDTLFLLLQQIYQDQPPELSRRQLQQLQGFIHFNWAYELCAVALYRLILRLAALGRLNELKPQQQQLLREKVLYHHSWQYLSEHLSYNGKSAAQQALRQTIAACCERL